MEIVNFLAKLWGFSLVIVCFSLLINQKNIKRVFKLVEDEGLLFLVGIINVILGIALVLSYGVFDSSWRIIITILGWLVLIRGSIILLFPHFVEKMVAKVKNRADWISVILVVAVFLGCVLLYLGFSA